MIQGGRIVKPENALPKEVQSEISSIILYFERYHGLNRLRALPDGFQISQVEELFGFPLYPGPGFPDGGIYIHYALDEAENFWDISSYDYLMQFNPAGQSYRAGDYTVDYDPETYELAIMRQGETVYSQSAAKIAKNLYRDNPEKGKGLYSKDEMSHLDKTEDLELLYVFTQFGGWVEDDADEIKIDYMSFYLFMKAGSEEN